VDGEQLQNVCRDKICLHLERQMVDHVLEQLSAGRESIPVIGCDARTGVPRRVDLTQSQLSDVPITSVV
jgi:hypothetical protein